MKKLIVTIDGPAASGKSTTARTVARRLGYKYLDTGAMYRAIGLKALRTGVSVEDEAGMAELARGTEVDVQTHRVELGAAVNRGFVRIGQLNG